MRKAIVFIFLLFPLLTVGQYKADMREELAALKYSEDTLATIYQWIIDRFRYDHVALYDLEKSGKRLKAVHAWHRKRGVCEHYAMFMAEALNELGYSARTVEGCTYGSQLTLSDIGHMWVAVRTTKGWRFFDPTWDDTDGNDSWGWYGLDFEEIEQNHWAISPAWQNDFENPEQRDSLLYELERMRVVDQMMYTLENSKKLEGSWCSRHLKRQLTNAKEQMELDELVNAYQNEAEQFRFFSEKLDALNNVASMSYEQLKENKQTIKKDLEAVIKSTKELDEMSLRLDSLYKAITAFTITVEDQELEDRRTEVLQSFFDFKNVMDQLVQRQPELAKELREMSRTIDEL